MPSTVTNRHRIRHSFGHIQAPLVVPHLLKIQLDSYERFLQREVPPDQRKNEGLEAVFRSVFPISDFSGSSTLEYVHYRLGDPKYSVEDCRIRGVTFACPVRAALRLIIWEKDDTSDVKHIRDIKEQDIYLGELPLMTPTGSFIVNGTERVIVSQMHKSPGVAILAEAADYGAQLDIVLLGGQDHQSGTERSSDYRDSRADTASHEMGHRSTMTCRRDQLAPLASGDGVGSIYSDAVSGGSVGRNVLIQRGLRFLTCNW